ncbi:unnamed protein product [Rotaria socialis]
MLNNVERISLLIPKLKQQLLFLEEREKLFRKVDDGSISCDGSISYDGSISSYGSISCDDSVSCDGSLINTSTIPKAPIFTATNAQTTPAVSVNSKSQSSISLSTPNLSSRMSMNNLTTGQVITVADTSSSFPDVYEVPILPKALLKDIESGNLKSFGPHCQSRQILIDAVVHDLIENYNLLYLSKTQYNIVGSALVRCLKLPSTPENLTIWKDALQTKLKRTRADYPNSSLVQVFRLKYSKVGSGRPVKQKIGEIVERDRHKQMVIMPYSNELSDEIQTKVVQLQNFSELEVSTQLRLWKETFIFRRQVVRDQSTSDIIKNFPAYSNPFLIFEEVKMLMNIDLSKEVRQQVPILLDKLVETPAFIADSSPIRLIKILCRKFGETVQHVFCENEPPTPYPTLVSIDGIIHIYVDFHPIVSTSSPDDALEKNIDIHREHLQLPSISSYSVSNDTTTLTNESQSQSQIVTNLLDHSIGKQNSFIVNQITTPTTSTDSSHLSVGVAFDTNECNGNNENVSPSDCNSQLQTRKKRKRKQNLNEEEQDDTSMKNAPQENVEYSLSRLPLASMTNSTVAIRQTKRKRRT